eukprot:gb/GFBE01041549.1/.p1 GENE.gb/GFBE01041549.1/~~gb/GFBE01041549.1/.p1  ORF type:complete len:343 (+),score=73.48 gb/GFBE01041549.1/:1-1029(+)
MRGRAQRRPAPGLAAAVTTAAGVGLLGREVTFAQSAAGAAQVSAEAPVPMLARVASAPQAKRLSGSAVSVAAAAAAGAVAGSRQASARRLAPVLGFAGFASAAATTRRAAPASMETVQAAGQRVKALIQEHDIIVFSKTTCPFCTRAKGVLKDEGSPFFVFELDELPPEETSAMQDALVAITGARTVPRVFVRGNCLGGCDDVVALQEKGELSKVIKSSAFQIQRSEDEWAKLLDPRKYQVLRRQGTEPPGSHEYDRFMPTKGHFACGACGLPLYSASSKFRSNCGWPVFKECYYSEAAGGCHVGTNAEFGGLEIVCNRCASHLGHVFFDAFKPDNPNGERH